MQSITQIIRKNLLVTGLAFAIALGVGFAATQAMTKSNANSFKTQCEAGVTCVDLYETGAAPYSVAVEVGSEVQFNAKGNATYHLATADEQGSLHADHGNHTKEHVSSGDFSGSEAWRVAFKEPGTYQFIDENNSNITVLVVAYRPGDDHKIE